MSKKLPLQSKHKLKRNKWAENRKHTFAPDFKLFKFQWRWNVSLIFTFASGWWDPKRLECFSHELDICCRQIHEKLSLLNPAEPCGVARHLFSAKASKLLHLTITATPPPDNEVLSSRNSGSLSQFLCLGLFPSCAVTSGCQQATTADTDGSEGLWWLPYVTLVLQECAFFIEFFPSLISFFVLVLKMAWWEAEVRL